ncbi:hypothetical protein PR202_gb17232 [Eleusine coracana subsp. coracana]|uniref:Uncharacterized protein n=1 Tax=Eleusine coracana subsp. coracana TaxID=191504 RepID=A0AAV5F3W4_ELECO|nr:hypothetical protein PR202_gb17212 [Eleusine coracana subsp. coracana]GJN29042.1 hypothetical protein PR202_gb17232 [Eleusine coracana subsp. coracana]
MPVPCGEDGLALSVQLVSFACGGFAVVWRTNHVLVDGSALALLVRAWSELVRSGTLPECLRPELDRSMLRPRAPPSYSASVNEALTILDGRRQVNALTTELSFVERLYYVEASDIAWLRDAASSSTDDGGNRRATRVQALSAYLWKALAGIVAGTGEECCSMSWRVNGRWKIKTPALQAAASNNYVGNVVALPVREESVQELLRMPLPDVAALVKETITEASYDERLQEVVDWVEDHKQPVTAIASFPIDTDFGFGRAAFEMNMSTCAARLCSGTVQILPHPGDDGSWIVSALVWPRLAAVLEKDIFKPLTADSLGLHAPQL